MNVDPDRSTLPKLYSVTEALGRYILGYVPLSFWFLWGLWFNQKPQWSFWKSMIKVRVLWASCTSSPRSPCSWPYHVRRIAYVFFGVFFLKPFFTQGRSTCSLSATHALAANTPIQFQTFTPDHCAAQPVFFRWSLSSSNWSSWGSTLGYLPLPLSAMGKSVQKSYELEVGVWNQWTMQYSWCSLVSVVKR